MALTQAAKTPTTRKGRGRALLQAPNGAAAIVGVAALAVYLATLARTIIYGDGPELTAAAHGAGVAHPPGYPLYTMLGFAFTHLLPFGSIAFRMNLLSALPAAATAALVYLLAYRASQSRLASAVGAFVFAFGLVFWSQAVSAEVYALHLLFVCAILASALEWDARGSRRLLYATAGLWGLSLTHHLSSVLLLPALAYLAATSRHRSQFLRELRGTLPLFLAPLLLYLYLPLSALRNPALNWGDPSTWSNFVAHVTGQQYRYMMGIHSFGELWRHVVAYGGWPQHGGNPGHLLTQFSVGLVWLAPWGAWGLFRWRRRVFWATLLLYLAVIAWSLSYGIADIEVYYLPSHMVVALWIACGLRQLRFVLARRWRRLPIPRYEKRQISSLTSAAMLGLPLILLAGNWQANNLRPDHSAHTMGRTVLARLKPNAILIAAGDRWLFPVLYEHYAENQRPDVAVIYLREILFPDFTRRITALSREGVLVRVPPSWQSRPSGLRDYALLKQVIADNLGQRPVYFLGLPEEMEHGDPRFRRSVPPYTQVPLILAPLMEVGAPPLTASGGQSPVATHTHAH